MKAVAAHRRTFPPNIAVSGSVGSCPPVDVQPRAAGFRARRPPWSSSICRSTSPP